MLKRHGAIIGILGQSRGNSNGNKTCDMAKTQFTSICRLLHLLLQPRFAKEAEACLCWKNESTAWSRTKYLKIPARNHSEICYKLQLCDSSNTESQIWGDFSGNWEEHLWAWTQRRPGGVQALSGRCAVVLLGATALASSSHMLHPLPLACFTSGSL